MKLFKKIFKSAFSLIFMLHLLALNVQSEYYLNFFNNNSISKDFDFEKESENNSKKCEKENTDSELDVFIENSDFTKKNKNLLAQKDISKNNFQFSDILYSLVYIPISIPPPDKILI